MRVFVVGGTHGKLTVNAANGNVVAYACSIHYANISRFDVLRYKKEFGEAIPDEVDIVDIGYWMDSGSYEPPIDFRPNEPQYEN